MNCDIGGIAHRCQTYFFTVAHTASLGYCSKLNDKINIFIVDYTKTLCCKGSGNFSVCQHLQYMTHSYPHEDVLFRILRLLQNNPEMSQRDLAKAVGVSVGRMNYVLKALVS